jgi:DNA-directed RNA polymerase
MTLLRRAIATTVHDGESAGDGAAADPHTPGLVGDSETGEALSRVELAHLLVAATNALVRRTARPSLPRRLRNLTEYWHDVAVPASTVLSITNGLQAAEPIVVGGGGRPQIPGMPSFANTFPIEPPHAGLREAAAKVTDHPPGSLLTADAVEAAVARRASGETDPSAVIYVARAEAALDLLGGGLTSTHPPRSTVADEHDSESLFHEQLSIESRAIDAAVARYQRLMSTIRDLGLAATLKPAQKILVTWYQPLVKAIKDEQREVLRVLRKEAREEGEAGSESSGPASKYDSGIDRHVYGPFLLLMSAQKLAVITMHEALGMALRSGTVGVTFTSAAVQIGKAVHTEAHLQVLQGGGKGSGGRSLKSVTPSALRKLRRRKAAVLRADVDAGPGTIAGTAGDHKDVSYELPDPSVAEWPTAILVKVGSALIARLLDTASIHETIHVEDDGQFSTAGAQVPAFVHAYRVERGKRSGILRTHPSVLKLVDAGHKLRESMAAHYLPMVVPPRPWRDMDDGGYLATPTRVMRTRGSKLQARALAQADLTDVYAALDVLGGTPWTVNDRVFEVAMEAWKAGGGLGELPQRSDVPIPERLPHGGVDASPEDRRRAAMDFRAALKRNAELHSLRCDTTYKLQVAKEFSGRTFYFPHNVDFRGRAYPVPPHLNHVGNDLCRGILCFAEGMPLGTDGLRWLKIHLANLFGHNKLTFDERIAWVESQMPAIRASARAPLDPSGSHWLEADDPWQALAACFELTDALDSCADPTTFVSRLPVHQDGTCNGLQHYAALGGDIDGAVAVNLLPSTKPQDVYSGVADLVAARVAEDAANGEPLAKLLDGRVNRKVVKQTVMTSVYGVTFVGANLQIKGQLEDIFEPLGTVMSPDVIRAASTYVTRLTFDALSTMFTGARETMNWLAVCARNVARTGQSVEWVTPLGLRIVQPYRRAGSGTMVRTLVQTVVLADGEEDTPVYVARQTSAFPPNYIHSLDSTHMMLTARACNAAGIQFASVHDSYWTHAATVGTMSRLLREEFVDLHSQPLLAHLREHFSVHHPTAEFPDCPTRGDLDLSQVVNSPYFFN